VRDPFYNDLPPEERIAAMQDEFERLDLEIERDRASLAERWRNVGPGPSKGLIRIRNAEIALEEKEVRSNWLFSQLHPVAIDGIGVVGQAGYQPCRSCGAQTGEEAAYERASLCTRCWKEWTPSTPATAHTEGTTP
jgi:hypothetical protein